jgi:hypothetical protein
MAGWMFSKPVKCLAKSGVVLFYPLREANKIAGVGLVEIVHAVQKMTG